MKWFVKNSNNDIISEGEKAADINQGEVKDVIDIEVDLSVIRKAERIELSVEVAGTAFRNSYSLWVYPAETDITVPQNIIVKERLDKTTLDQLSRGASVLLFPDHKSISELSVGGLFTPDYWNYPMFKGISESNRKPVSPGTLSILTDPENPLFIDFPTEFHTNWQWWPIVKSSRPFILDNTPEDYRPLVQVVDNIERNHKLGLIFEFAIGNGKLLVCMADLKSVEDKPEARQLYSSILQYMSSDKFNPLQMLTTEELSELFSTRVSDRKITSVRNMSYN